MGKYSDTGCYDAVMIGAGPAGLAAAITLKRTAPDARVLLLEKMHGPARKLSASGNGRGNLSNVKCEDLEEALKFFSETGIALRTDDEGRIYPYSEDARTVTETLIKRAETEGVVILNDTQVVNVEACSGKGTGFRVFVSGKNGDGRHAGGSRPKGQEILRAANVLIATGGKSYGVYGSTGDGYKMAKALGHTVVPPVPGLTAIETAEPLASAAGTRVKGEVSLFKDGDLIFKERGEIQFRDDSISGICVMNMSSMLPAGVSCLDGAGRFEGYMIRINLVPDFSAAALIGFLRENNLQTADDCSDGGGCVRSAAVRIPATLVKKAIKNAATVEDLLLLNKPDRLQLTARVYTCEGGWPVTDSKYIWSGNDLMEWAEHAKRTFGESVNGVLDFNKNDFLLPSGFPNEMLLAYGKDQYVKSISMVGCQPTEISFTSSETEGPWVALRISLNEYKNLLMHCNCVKLFQGLRPVSAASKEGPYNAIVRATFRKEPGYDYVVSGGKRVKDCAKYAKRFKDLKTAERVAKQFNEKLGARGFHFEAVIID